MRRMLRRGQLEGERAHRAQGSAYVVRLPADPAHATADATATQQLAGNVSRANATKQPAVTMASLIQPTIASVLAPLVAVNERQAEHVAELERENEVLRGRQGSTSRVSSVGLGASAGPAPGTVRPNPQVRKDLFLDDP